MSWQVIGNHIAIAEGRKVAHLEAIDVYSALKEDLIFDGVPQSSLEESFPEMVWSPMGKYADVKIALNNDSIELWVEVESHPVDFVGSRIIDQIIVGNNWFYIANAEEINELFSGLDIQSNGRIEMNQYISLLKRDFNVGLIQKTNDTAQLVIDLDYSKPNGLVAELYEYQKNGFMWLDYMLRNNGGCILGDEMGLGKTLQAISLIVKRKSEGKKSLVVAPVSLLENWKNECYKFAPCLKVLLHHGGKRTGSPNTFENYDVVVTSYGHAVTDHVLFSMIQWDLVIIDEAQNIKNPRSERAKSVKAIDSNERLAITGTPFENHVLDVWSLLDFVSPGLCKDESTFKKTITDDIEGAKKLEPILTSLMLRRLVRDVAKDLPEKVIIAQPISFSDNEIALYEESRSELLGVKNATLPMLQKLRMFCTHPSLLNDVNDSNPYDLSLKYQRTCEILEEIFARGEKAIIFTSYQRMFDIFEKDLQKRFGIYVNHINGSTPVEDRQIIVDEFNNLSGAGVLVLNPRAAGTGLNITGANHVIHYNLEWNPALEDQASARAYRRGQKRTTFIYRLFYKNSVEEIINQRLERKREMSEEAVVGVDGSQADMEDIIAAINISPLEGGAK